MDWFVNLKLTKYLFSNIIYFLKWSNKLSPTNYFPWFLFIPTTSERQSLFGSIIYCFKNLRTIIIKFFFVVKCIISNFQYLFSYDAVLDWLAGWLMILAPALDRLYGKVWWWYEDDRSWDEEITRTAYAYSFRTNWRDLLSAA